ncbi:hypothetical protein MTO96_013811 [Rhipicephalus appendiculatus]
MRSMTLLSERCRGDALCCGRGRLFRFAETGSRGRCEATIAAVTCAMHWHGVRRGAGERLSPWLPIAPPARRQGRPQFIGNRCLPIRSNRWPLTTCPEYSPRRVGADTTRAARVSMGRPRNAAHTVVQTRSLERFTPRRRSAKPSGFPRLGLSRHIPAGTGALSLLRRRTRPPWLQQVVRNCIHRLSQNACVRDLTAGAAAGPAAVQLEIIRMLKAAGRLSAFLSGRGRL